jgi:uncharacterized membrane protein
MEIQQAVLVAATFLSSLTAGLVFTFAVVVMPGIRSLPDRDYLRAFQVMDRVIQENDPLFLLVWVGSALAVVVGVQLPTFAINVPLNNRLQALDLDVLDQAALGAAREAFEARWNRWNSIRTVLASLTALMLLIVLASCAPEPSADQGAGVGEDAAGAAWRSLTRAWPRRTTPPPPTCARSATCTTLSSSMKTAPVLCAACASSSGRIRRGSASLISTPDQATSCWRAAPVTRMS